METLPLSFVKSENPVINYGYEPIIQEKVNKKSLDSLKTWKIYAALFAINIFCYMGVTLFSKQHFILQPTANLLLNDSIPFKMMTHPLQPTRAWGNIKKPYPTGAWWLNLAIDGGCVVPMPYAARMLPSGLVVSYPVGYRVVSPHGVQDGCGTDLIVGALEFLYDAEISRQYVFGYTIHAYDELSVTLKVDTSEEHAFFAYLVSGSPFVTTEYSGGVPAIYSGSNLFTSVNGSETRGTRFTGTSFIVTLPNSIQWVIFASKAITFTWLEHGTLAASTLAATGGFWGTLKFAVCILPTTCEELAKFRSAHATGGEVSYDIQGDDATITYNWKKEGTGDLLMLAAGHHMDILESPQTALERHILSMKGPLVGVVGDSWVMNEKLTTITWDSPIKVDPNSPEGQAILQQLLLDSEVAVRNIVAMDPYGCGKELGKTARLALIADEFGLTDTVTALVIALEQKIVRWLDNQNRDYLVYDTTWGGVVTFQGLQSSSADFGNGWYNDHHFQYGYFVYAMAVVQHFNSSFYDRYGKLCDFFIGDIAEQNRNSSLHPFARHKDFWAFHSWAGGLFPQGDGKNQESSTEAINAYYGVMLYGLAIHNQTVYDWGRLLLAMEIRGTKKYWHMTDASVYDAVFAANRMVGNIGSLDAVDSTWFGNNHVYVHGINMMPFTPITEEVLDCEFVTLEYPVLENYIAGVMDQWKGFAYLDHAVIDKDSAWAEFNSLTIFDDGITKTAGLHWIATRPVCKAPPAPTPTSLLVVLDSTCASSTTCLGMGLFAGECCPTATGAFLGCCPKAITYPVVEKPASGTCALSPQCSSLGLSGGCCPTVEGIYLSCCADILGKGALNMTTDNHKLAPVVHLPPAALGTCSTDPGCAPLHLNGDCCPTPNGMYLGCCSEAPHVDIAKGTCASDPGCAPLNLKGDCCPTSAGTFLDCCANKTAESQIPKPSGTCSTDPGCAPLHLEGDCCPTSTGSYLGCCSSSSHSAPSPQQPKVSKEAGCVFYPKCAAIHLTGNCCPTDGGMELDCCGP